MKNHSNCQTCGSPFVFEMLLLFTNDDGEAVRQAICRECYDNLSNPNHSMNFCSICYEVDELGYWSWYNHEGYCSSCLEVMRESWDRELELAI